MPRLIIGLFCFVLIEVVELLVVGGLAVLGSFSSVFYTLLVAM
jgi:hypothetical protein